jgi:transposase InsO family protein
LVNRQRVVDGREVVNAKRAYRVMAEAKLLLPKAPRRPQSSRKHEGKMAVSTSGTRWRSDGFEITCDSGETVTAKSFVNNFKRDYVSRMDLADATTVMAQLPSAFEHFNDVHPHSSLKMRSPREFGQHQQRVAQTRCASTSASTVSGYAGGRPPASKRTVGCGCLAPPPPTY